VAGVGGSAAGLLIARLAPTNGKLQDAATGALAAVVALVVFGAVAYTLDRDDLRMVAGRLRRFARGRSSAAGPRA
jgi:hypothetical protein